jgi:hypothetical protein
MVLLAESEVISKAKAVTVRVGTVHVGTVQVGTVHVGNVQVGDVHVGAVQVEVEDEDDVTTTGEA